MRRKGLGRESNEAFEEIKRLSSTKVRGLLELLVRLETGN